MARPVVEACARMAMVCGGYVVDYVLALRLRDRLRVLLDQADAGPYGGRGHQGGRQGRHPVADGLPGRAMRVDGGQVTAALPGRGVAPQPSHLLVLDAGRHDAGVRNRLPDELVAHKRGIEEVV